MCCNTGSVLQAGKDMGGRDCIAIQFLYCNLVGLNLCFNAQDCITIEWQLGWKLYCRGSIVLQYSGVKWVKKKIVLQYTSVYCDRHGRNMGDDELISVENISILSSILGRAKRNKIMMS